MTKIYCIKKSTFNKIIGYGCWAVITAGLLMFLFAGIIEYSGSELRHTDSPLGDYRCAKSILTDYVMCDQWLYGAIFFDITTNATNFLVIGLWTYFKQNRFKFAFCENVKKEGEEK